MKISRVKKLDPLQRLLYWISERESIRIKRLRGLPPPWTDDEILARYRFTNVRRMDDRVSQWLMDNWYRPYFDHPNMLYAAALARFINLPRSLGAITSLVFPSWDEPPLWSEIKKTLRRLKQLGPVFNGAYMVRGNDGEDKVSSVVDYYIGALVKVSPTVDTDSMERTHAKITAVYGFGSFMAGQVVADLRWAVSGKWFDKNHWAPMGPGSRKGAAILFSEHPSKNSINQEEFEGRLEYVIDECKLHLPTSITDRLEAMDYQNCLCELMKYNKALLGEGRPKVIFRPHSRENHE